MIELTGQAIYDSNQEKHKHLTWDELQPESQAIYDRAAVNLEKALHYEEMIALIKDYKACLEETFKLIGRDRPPQFIESNLHERGACIGLWPEFDEEMAIKEYTRLMDLGPLGETEGELHALIQRAYGHGLYFDFDRKKDGYVLRRKESD